MQESLLEFRCTNFKSICDEVNLSMIASIDNSHDINTIGLDYSKRCLKSVGIHGANGSGKTCILDAIWKMRSTVMCKEYSLDKNLDYCPHGKSDNKGTVLSVKISCEGIEYDYGFTFDESGIIKESLFYSPKGRIAVVFKRDSEGIQYGNAFTKVFGNHGDSCPKNILLLSYLRFHIGSRCEEIRNVYSFFENMRYLREEKLDSSFDFREEGKVFEILKLVSPGLIDVKLSSAKHNDDETKENEDFRNVKNLIMVYDDGFEIPFKDESKGVKKFISTLAKCSVIIKHGGVLLVDDLGSTLHPAIVKHILRMFFEDEKCHFQLLYTSNEAELLDLGLLRRDQILFAELQMNNRNTKLCSLYDKGNVRKDEKIRKGYMEGRYCFVPKDSKFGI